MLPTRMTRRLRNREVLRHSFAETRFPLVSFGDDKEVARVRDNFPQKKLGLSQSDAELDAAIKSVSDKMKADKTKNRVTVY